MPNLSEIWSHFDGETLAKICEASEGSFVTTYEMDRVQVDQAAPNDWYAFRDNGASILAVAHLDTVADHKDRRCSFLNTSGGPVVYSRALDDRLGAYVILDLLPKLGIVTDVLLTVGEESGSSTAYYFEPELGKEYNWIIEFDRGGTDVVLYQYEDPDTVEMVESIGARVGQGSFSDISFLDHVGVKAFNWGVGYRDYHGPRSHAYLDDTISMVEKFVAFHDTYGDLHLPHVNAPASTSDPDEWDWDDEHRAYFDAEDRELREWLVNNA